MSYNEKWERTKRYLFRNLLEDPGYRLSPVTEESVSDDIVSRPRSCSPLPDLVIEPEPNRHDDPPEFYQGLEVNMRRLYKRLVDDRASSEETEGLINLEKDILEYNADQHLLESYQATSNESDSKIFNTNNALKEIQNMSKENKDKSTDDISPVIGLGRATIVNRTTEMEFTESNFDCAHFISTGNDKNEETMDDVEMTNAKVTLEPIKEVNRDSEKNKQSAEDIEEQELFEFIKGFNVGTDAVSASERSFASNKSSSRGRKRLQNADECDISFELAMRKEAFKKINKRKIFDHSSQVESETEELIFVQQINDDDSDLDSYEIAMCREKFRRINRRKGFGQRSGEHSVTEDEELEEMRGAPLTDPLQAFKRRSTANQESLLGTFAKPTVAEIHEDISIGDEGSEEWTGMKSSVLGCSSAKKYKDAKVFPGPLKSQSGIGIEDSGAQNSPDSHNTDDISDNKPTKSFRLEVRESSVGTEEATPSAPKDNVRSTLSVPTKRRQKFSSDIPKKRKKYKNQAVQTSTDPDPWETIKSDFFVGTPRIFKLCSCNDNHTCR